MYTSLAVTWLKKEILNTKLNNIKVNLKKLKVNASGGVAYPNEANCLVWNSGY